MSRLEETARQAYSLQQIDAEQRAQLAAAQAQEQYGPYLPQFEEIARQLYDAQTGGEIEQISPIQTSGEEKSDSQTPASDDIMSEARNSIKEDWADGEEREETREDFTRRITAEGFTVQDTGADGKGRTIAYGYRAVHPQGYMGEIQKGLSEFGIQAFFIDEPIWQNYKGVSGKEISRRLSVSEAATARGLGVFINVNTAIPPMRVVGHEAFHFWENSHARDIFVEILRANLEISSDAVRAYAATFQHFYIEGEVDVFDPKQMDLFQEELFAYISGELHEGGHDDTLRPMFRDFDAVKAGWKMLVETRRKGVL